MHDLRLRMFPVGITYQTTFLSQNIALFLSILEFQQDPLGTRSLLGESNVFQAVGS